MDTKDLIQTRMRYEMSLNFFRGLLNDGKLTKVEFEKAAKYVDKKYDIENLEIELRQLKSSKIQLNVLKAEYNLTIHPTTGKTDSEYISLTNIAKQFSDEAPSYIIQSWMRNRNTLEFLKLWEQRHNNRFKMDGYKTLMDKLNSGVFTMTPKQWIAHTDAIGVLTRSGKNGGTKAHPLLATEFIMWLNPEYRLNFLELNNMRGGGQ